MAAYWLGMDKKGRVQSGCDADLVLFDPARVKDTSTYINPGSPSEGIPYVLINGVAVVEKGKATGAKPGEVVKRTWKVPGEYPNMGRPAALSVAELNR